MISRVEQGTFVVVAVAIFLGAVVISGNEISLGWAAYIGATITAVGLVVAMYDRWLWKWWWLQGWFVERPELGGVWDVTITTNWVNPETQDARGSIEATFVIKQTRTSVHARMESEESVGELLCGDFVRHDGSGYRLVGTFRNEPRFPGRMTSPIHYGTFLLDVEGKASNPRSMTGHYWTDRGTRGRITAMRR